MGGRERERNRVGERERGRGARDIGSWSHTLTVGDVC